MIEIDALSRRLLGEMSEDSRQSFRALSKKLKRSPQTLKKRIAALEKRYGIRYVLELEEKELGLVATYLVKIKFSKAPPESLLMRCLKKHNAPQFAALMKGDYDLLIYVAAPTHIEFTKWFNYFRQALSNYLENWEAGVITGYWFGFFPLNEAILKGVRIREPKRTMLRLLNENARISLKELAQKTKLPVSTAQYHVKQILSSKYVRRCTMMMEKPPYNIYLAVLWSYRMSKDFTRKDLKVRSVLISESDYEPMNRLCLTFNSAGWRFDDVLVYSFEKLSDGYDFVSKCSELFANEAAMREYAFVMKVLLGRMPFRKLNVKRTYRTDFVNIYDYMEK